MRLRSFVCATVATAGLVFGVASSADAADPKGKKKGASGGDSLADDKVIGKQLQWENQVMGSDDGKKAELEKILRAQAINKAAQEKAEREKEKAEKERAAKEAAAARQQSKKSGEVALPTLSDEEPASSGKGKSKSTEAASEMETAVATPPPPPAKPADDKFIDKLLREEGGGKKKKASAGPDDKELIDILAGDKKDKPAEKGKKARKDSVDALLLEADKEPAPAPKVKHETPEWAKPEIQSVPTPAPVAVRPPPVKKQDDGVIRVVQGAAPTGRSVVPPAPRTAPAPTPLVPASRKQAASSSSSDWDDPFAEPARKGGAAKSVASRHSRAMDDDELTPPRRGAAAPLSKREASRPTAPMRSNRSSEAGWDDPFTDTDRKAAPRRGAPASKPAKSTDRKAPARGGRWEDPFTEAPASKGKAAPAVAKRATPASKSSRIVVSKRAPAGKVKAKPAALAMHDGAAKEEGSKWGAATRRGSAELAAATPAHASGGRWGVLKKR